MKTTVYRKFHGANVESDWQRLRALRQVCDQVEGVSTPAPLKVDLVGQAIVYEHATFPTPLIAYVGDDRTFRKLGDLLARMHRANFGVESGYFSNDPYPLDTFGLDASDLATLCASVPVGWFHSDFWHGNVFCDSVDKLIIIDPLPARCLYVGHYIRASGVLDLASMYMGLLLCHPLRNQLWFDVDAHIHAAEALLDGYFGRDGECPEAVLKATRRLSRSVGLHFIDGYMHRLSPPVARLKRMAAMKLLARIDEKIDWKAA